MESQFIQGNPLFTDINTVAIQYPYLVDNINTEVIIVGGGVTGAICSYYLSKNNISAVILEKGRIAHGSTSITTSLLQYELDKSFGKLSKILPLKDIVKAYKLGVKALDELHKFIDEQGNRCDYEKRNTLLYTDKKLDIKEIEEEFKFRQDNNFNVKLIKEENNPYSFTLKAGILCENAGAELDPYKYTHQLLDISTKLGLRVYENTEVVKVNYLQDFVEVETLYGKKVRGKKIVVATGYNTSLFTDRNFATKSTSFNIATKPVKNFEGWKDRSLIRDNGDPYTYIRTTKDGRIIIGGEDVQFIPDINNEKLAEEKYSILEQKLKFMFKEIDNIEIEYRYCGCFASTTDNLGFIGPDPVHKNLWYCLGYGANGILFAILGGMMLSKLYKGEHCEDMKLFKVDRFDN